GLCSFLVAPQLPIEPIDGELRDPTAIGLSERAPMPNIAVDEHGGNMRNPRVVVGAVRVGDVALTADEIDDRRVDGLEDRLVHTDALDWIAAVREDAAVVHENGADPWVRRDLQSLKAAAAMSTDRNFLSVDQAFVAAAGAAVFGQRPVNARCDILCG